MEGTGGGAKGIEAQLAVIWIVAILYIIFYIYATLIAYGFYLQLRKGEYEKKGFWRGVGNTLSRAAGVRTSGASAAPSRKVSASRSVASNVKKNASKQTTKSKK